MFFKSKNFVNLLKQKNTRKMEKVILKSLQEVSEKLNAKYCKIHDFNTYVDYNAIRGGFYKMSYQDRLANNGCVEYYFRETFGRINEKWGVKTFDDLYQYLDKNIQRQLKEQKELDENYAAEFNKKVEYKYDYSCIE